MLLEYFAAKSVESEAELCARRLSLQRFHAFYSLPAADLVALGTDRPEEPLAELLAMALKARDWSTGGHIHRRKEAER